MKVSLDTGDRSNPKNLAERTITEAIFIPNSNETQVAIHWPAGQGSFLSVQPDGSWGQKNTVDGAFEIANLVPEGFEFNPDWPNNGAKSILIGGRILER